MSQLSQLCRMPLWIGSVAVHEVSVADLETFVALSSAFAHEFQKGGRLASFYFSDGIGLEPDVFEHYRVQMTAALLLCLNGEPPPEDLREACEAMLLCNRAFFMREMPSEDNRRDLDWYDAFQFLISTGHAYADILTYPYSVFLGFCRAAGKMAGRLA